MASYPVLTAPPEEEPIRVSPTEVSVPSWVTRELIEQTVRTWQPYYLAPLTDADAIEIIYNAGRLIHLLASESTA